MAFCFVTAERRKETSSERVKRETVNYLSSTFSHGDCFLICEPQNGGCTNLDFDPDSSPNPNVSLGQSIEQCLMSGCLRVKSILVYLLPCLTRFAHHTVFKQMVGPIDPPIKRWLITRKNPSGISMWTETIQKEGGKVKERTKEEKADEKHVSDKDCSSKPKNFSDRYFSVASKK